MADPPREDKPQPEKGEAIMSARGKAGVIAVVVLALAAGPVAHAAVLYDSQGFEDAQPNSTPANAQHPNSPATVYQLGPVQVGNDLQQDGYWPAEGGGGAEIKASGGNQYLELSPSANGRYRRYFGEPSQDSGNVAADGDPVYRGHWLSLATLPTKADGAVYMAFDRGGPPVPGALRGELFVKPDGAGGYLVGVSNGTADPTLAVFSPTALALDTDYVVIDKLVADAGTGVYSHTLWINPVNESSPSVDATDPATSNFGGTTVGVNGFSPVQNNFFGNGASPGTVRIDNLIIATTWDEAFLVIPEPATMSVLALGGLCVLLRRRRGA